MTQIVLRVALPLKIPRWSIFDGVFMYNNRRCISMLSVSYIQKTIQRNYLYTQLEIIIKNNPKELS